MPLLHLLHLFWHGGINLAGIAMVTVGFGVAFLVQESIGALPEGALMMIAGPLIVGLDFFYRSRLPDKSWWAFRKGGGLLFLPAWQLGAFWFGLGACYLIWPDLQ